MLYTGKGDNGTTKTYGCDQRISKSSKITEALGCLDEINSFLGLVKVRSAEKDSKFFEIENQTLENLVFEIQENLFIIQAEVAGADKHIEVSKIKKVESIIDQIEKELPPIKTFFVSGGTELASLFDMARTIARRAERRVVAVAEDYDNSDVNNENKTKINNETLIYLNRLSSFLYSLARLMNHKSGIKEGAPTYK